MTNTIKVKGTDPIQVKNTELKGKLPAGTIELGLFAPYNERVQLLGSWTNWQPIEMNKGDDGWWRAAVELADGEYQYKFRVKSLSYFAARAGAGCFRSVLAVSDGRRKRELDPAHGIKKEHARRCLNTNGSTMTNRCRRIANWSFTRCTSLILPARRAGNSTM